MLVYGSTGLVNIETENRHFPKPNKSKAGKDRDPECPISRSRDRNRSRHSLRSGSLVIINSVIKNSVKSDDPHCHVSKKSFLKLRRSLAISNSLIRGKSLQ